MPKKYQIEQNRKWLEHREQGKSEQWIANYYKCDIRTIIKGIEVARLEREVSVARIELMKEILRDHQKELLVILDGIVSMLELPAYNMEIRRERDGRIAPIPLSGAIVRPDEENELTLTIQDENSLKWELLKEHLKGDKLWKMIKQWKYTILVHVNARVALMDTAQRLLEKKTGLKLVQKTTEPPKSGGIFPAAVQVFYELAMCRALDIRNETDLEERLVATDDGYVRNGPGGTEYAYAPGAQEKCREEFLVALKRLNNSQNIMQATDSYTVAGIRTNEVRRIAEEISLMRFLPNRCRVCKRLGM